MTTIIQLDGLNIKAPSWASDKRLSYQEILLTNPNGYTLLLKVVRHQQDVYLIIGNNVYSVIIQKDENSAFNLENINPIGNFQWFKFFNRKYAQSVNTYQFNLPLDKPRPHEPLRLFPFNSIQYPCLTPSIIYDDDIVQIREKLKHIVGEREFVEYTDEDNKRITYNIHQLLNYLVIIAQNGSALDYHDSQNVLNFLKQYVADGNENEITLQTIINIKDFILLSRTGVNWDKWKTIKDGFRINPADFIGSENSTQRTLTIFEREVETARLRTSHDLIQNDNRGKLKSWKVVKVTALCKDDNELQELANATNAGKANKTMVDSKTPQTFNNQDIETTKEQFDINEKVEHFANVFGFGETLIGNAIIVSLAFAGGSATTVKKVMGKNKLVHLALKVKTSLNRIKWINLLQARAGLILGENPHSKIVFVTNLEGSNGGESESSTLDFLHEKYSKELSTKQIYSVNQRSGFILDTKNGEPLRHKDGSLALVAENHLWAFLALLLNKKRIIDIIQNTTGIITIGNGDNILNYPRPGMVGEIEYARRREGRAVATVAVASPSAGDRKGGFAAKVTYRNIETDEQITQIELREISEFPTRGKDGFSAVDISSEEGNDFYKKAHEHSWFIEDIFKNSDGTDKEVAFNIAFYAVDLRLIISRIFGFDESKRDLVQLLNQIDNQEWVDKITNIGEAVPAIKLTDKSSPNEDGSEEVQGFMTEQMVQDFIVNALALLETPKGLPAPEVIIRLADRKVFFLPYKGKNQYELDEEGKTILDPKTGIPIEKYDLIANQRRYAGVVRDHLKNNGHRLILGPNEHVTEIVPVDFETLKNINKNVVPKKRVPFP